MKKEKFIQILKMTTMLTTTMNPPWLKLLPYSDRLDDKKWLADIIKGIALSASSRDLLGLSFWFKELDRFIGFKFVLTLEDRIWCIRLGLDLLSRLEDIRLVELIATVTEKLVRSETKLPDNSLDIDWEPLYKILHKLVLPSKKELYQQQSVYLLQPMIKCITACRRFFTPDAGRQILECLLPMLNYYQVNDLTACLAMLALLLPTHHPVCHWKEWIPTLFEIWDLISGVQQFDMQLIELFGRLAKDQLESDTKVDWTQDQIKKIYVSGIDFFELPVGSGESGLKTSGGQGHHGNAMRLHSQQIQISDALKANQLEHFGNFIVHSIFLESSGLNPFSFEQFKRLIYTLEIYCHPSNTGQWSFPISKLVCNMADALHYRVYKEKLSESKVPLNHRLDSACVDEMTGHLGRVARLLLFAKDPRVVSVTLSSLKLLGWVSPSVLFPPLLEKIYPSLQTLTETNRTLSAMSVLGPTVLPLINRSNYEMGSQHLVPLLYLVLPGIDINDIWKSSATLLFISVAASTVSLVNVATFSSEGESENDANARLSTNEFEGWTLQFFEKVFELVGNLPQNYGVESSQNTQEGGLMRQLHVIFVNLEYL